MTKGNGNKDPIAQVVEHLGALRTELRAELRELRVDMNAGFNHVGVRVDHLEVSINSRLDKVVENTGGHHRRLEERVAALEAKMH